MYCLFYMFLWDKDVRYVNWKCALQVSLLRNKSPEGEEGSQVMKESRDVLCLSERSYSWSFQLEIQLSSWILCLQIWLLGLSGFLFKWLYQVRNSYFWLRKNTFVIVYYISQFSFFDSIQQEWWVEQLMKGWFLVNLSFTIIFIFRILKYICIGLDVRFFF